MGFFQTLKEKLTGKKAEQASLPTLDSIQQENADLTKKEEQVAQTIAGAPVQATPSTEPGKTVVESIGPEPESVAIPAAAAVAKKSSKKKKAAKKKAVKKVSKKKVVKKAVKKAKAKPAKKAGKKKKK